MDLDLASQRLMQSRERLRQQLREMSNPHDPRHSGAPAGAAPPSGQTSGVHRAPAWWDDLLSSPALAGWVETVRGWWWQHPLRVYGIVAAEAGAALARPVAQRHPVALMAGAAAVGALLVWCRPWRWVLRPALFAGLLPRLASQAVSQMPLQSWVAALSAVTKPARQP